MGNQDLYDQLEKDEGLTDAERREIYFSARDEEEDRQCYYCGQESCDCEML